MVNTPVLYITFARPEYASQSFAAIKKAQPKKLYFYSNKARTEKEDEVKRNQEVRSYIEQIDWECDVKTWFREEYVDVFTSIKGAIDWVFSNEEKAIVIEEDVVTSLAFFDYMDQMIERYRDNDRIWIISGNNGSPKYSPKGMKCFVTRTADIYGWASWRKRWNCVDWNMKEWDKEGAKNRFRKYCGDYGLFLYNMLHYNQLYIKIRNTDYKPWDMLFNFSMRMNNGYCLTPYTNLAKDIGLYGANHSKGIESPINAITINTPNFSVDENECCLEPSAFDQKYFYRVRLLEQIKRRIRM